MRLSRFFRRDDGAAMVEMAIVLPLFLLLVFGVIDFGRLLFTSNSMASAVREGARQAAVMADPVASQAVVKARVEAAFTPFGGPAITDAEISIDVGIVPGSVVVTVTGYPWQPITPLASFLSATIPPITRKATFRLERSSS
jgi:Flp pilus assembly protein TadG